MNRISIPTPGLAQRTLYAEPQRGRPMRDARACCICLSLRGSGFISQRLRGLKPPAIHGRTAPRFITQTSNAHRYD
jgi:hypothetical protein